MSTGTNTPRAYFAGLWPPSKEAPKGTNRWLGCGGLEGNRTLEKGPETSSSLLQTTTLQTANGVPAICTVFRPVGRCSVTASEARLPLLETKWPLWKKSKKSPAGAPPVGKVEGQEGIAL